MPILFSAVTKNKTILEKYASCEGNFEEIVKQVISQSTGRNEKMTYIHGHYLFHYVVENKYMYFCITDKVCQRSRAFLFLNEIKRRFHTKVEDFSRILAEEMYRYSDDYSTITVQKGELDELNSIGVESSENILGQKILYVKNADSLSYSTISYASKKPHHTRVSVNVIYSKLYALIVIIVFSACILVYMFGPVACIAMSGIILLSYARCKS